MENFETVLNTFVSGAQAIIDKDLLDHPFGKKLTIDPKGRKYARIVVTDTHKNGDPLSGDRGGSVYCFIDKTNGNVLKADGWKGPAKGPRSNIYNDKNGLDGVGPYGANYRYR